MTAPTLTVDTNDATNATQEPPDLGLLRLGGRYFISQRKTTQRQDTYVWTRLEEANLEKLQNEVGADGDISELAIGIIKAAYEKDTLYEIVGALLTETNKHGEPLPLKDKHGNPQRWTVEQARDIANLVANLEEKDEKEQLNPMINAILILFFTTGVGSHLTSPSSSETAPVTLSPDSPISSETPRPDGSSADEPSALLARALAVGDTDPTITASGTKPSAPAPSMTPTP